MFLNLLDKKQPPPKVAQTKRRKGIAMIKKSAMIFLMIFSLVGCEGAGVESKTGLSENTSTLAIAVVTPTPESSEVYYSIKNKTGQEVGGDTTISGKKSLKTLPSGEYVISFDETQKSYPLPAIKDQTISFPQQKSIVIGYINENELHATVVLTPGEVDISTTEGETVLEKIQIEKETTIFLSIGKYIFNGKEVFVTTKFYTCGGAKPQYIEICE